MQRLKKKGKKWSKTFDNKYRAHNRGFNERNAFKAVRPKPGVRVLDTLARLEYKKDNGTLPKRKAHRA
jgi:hypothetical protein